ncbi:TlpA family protein disulfide reductase [Archangium violaceum]|uniref:TlpA family protein disulfide reductase n=1 Tax=Archangium violaceum TaxID=83451 RepID=UPI00193C0A93|nr:TlpA disulfide reductase family protein [Archangium violaceum]QRK07773.1 TlpA family protein disulfide reductase [Archangium violaceum]
MPVVAHEPREEPRLGPRAHLGRFPLPLVVLVLAGMMSAVASGCRTEPPPSYVRLEGAAPELQGLPDSSALLVVFWASWCPPCRQETPGLLALAEEPPEGLQVVVFSHDTDMKAVETFLGGVPAPGLHLRLDEGRRAASALGVDTLPTSLLVVNGRLVARFQGPREWNSRGMRRLLEKLTRERSSHAPAPAH